MQYKIVYAVYGLLLLGFIVWSFVGRKDKIKELWKLAVWVLIILILVMVYSYIPDMRNRIAVELFPYMAIDTGDALMIKRANDGHFYVQASLNGHKITFLIDTGATSTVIPLGYAKKIGIDVDSLKFNRLYKTANGNKMNAIAMIDEFAMGDMVLCNKNIVVTNTKDATPLLGISSLRELVKYEIEGDVMLLYTPHRNTVRDCHIGK